MAKVKVAPDLLPPAARQIEEWETDDVILPCCECWLEIAGDRALLIHYPDGKLGRLANSSDYTLTYGGLQLSAVIRFGHLVRMDVIAPDDLAPPPQLAGFDLWGA